MTDQEPKKAGAGMPTSLRLSADGLALMDKLGKKLGLKRSAVIELAIRRLAKTEGVE